MNYWSNIQMIPNKAWKLCLKWVLARDPEALDPIILLVRFLGYKGGIDEVDSLLCHPSSTWPMSPLPPSWKNHHEAPFLRFSLHKWSGGHLRLVRAILFPSCSTMDSVTALHAYASWSHEQSDTSGVHGNKHIPQLFSSAPVCTLYHGLWERVFSAFPA